MQQQQQQQVKRKRGGVLLHREQLPVMVMIWQHFRRLGCVKEHKRKQEAASSRVRIGWSYVVLDLGMVANGGVGPRRWAVESRQSRAEAAARSTGGRAVFSLYFGGQPPDSTPLGCATPRHRTSGSSGGSSARTSRTRTRELRARTTNYERELSAPCSAHSQPQTTRRAARVFIWRT